LILSQSTANLHRSVSIDQQSTDLRPSSFISLDPQSDDKMQICVSVHLPQTMAFGFESLSQLLPGDETTCAWIFSGLPLRITDTDKCG
jgi:hypothetical protein